MAITATSGVTATAAAAGPLDAARIVADRRAAFDEGLTRPLEWRREQLRQVQRMLQENEAELNGALAADLGKPAIEGWIAELGFTIAEIDEMLRHLAKWLRPERVRVPAKLRPGRARIVREPLGAVLVIAPWNYPLQLLLTPMAGAIAAGNCVVGKPSEVAPNVSAAVGRLVPRYLDQRAVTIVEGGIDETTALLDQRWDHIFYTGNGRVGRVVMSAAAKHLTPVTLELGGKSPTIVDRSANLGVAARRIAWGKFINAGQTCVAPDYVLVDRAVEAPFIEALRGAVRAFFGEDPAASPDYARIVNDAHVRRVAGLIDGGGYEGVVCGGQVDAANRYIAPTVLRGVDAGAPVMGEEIFGPVLPVLAVDGVEAAIDFVNQRDKPLALYVFAEDKSVVDRVVEGTSSGGVCVNASVLHLSIPGLPFGGVGESGMGAYHGRHTVETFSHRKAVLDRPVRPDPPVLYPPYSRLKRALLRRLT